MAAAADPGLEREEASMISVAMAVYNGEMYLQEQLDSIFSQTDPVDEIVIVDDCSSDGTMD
ncbi:glycosyltransferase, partial [Faecalibaculum rodentium]